MKRSQPNFKAAHYVDIQKHWKRLGPLFNSPAALRIWKPCLLEFVIIDAENQGRSMPQKNVDYYASREWPCQFDACDWRWERGRSGPHPAFWKFVCHSACHWLVDLGMFVAVTAWPKQPWQILSAQKHSTIWNGDHRKPLLFDGNFSALSVSPDEALRLAWPGRKLKPHKYLKGYLHNGGAQ